MRNIYWVRRESRIRPNACSDCLVFILALLRCWLVNKKYVSVIVIGHINLTVKRVNSDVEDPMT